MATIPTVPLVYDAGALIAAEAGDRFMVGLHRRSIDRQRVTIVPSPALTQVWRGGGRRQARLAFLLRACVIHTPGEAVAKLAGTLLGRTGTSDAVDALVVATAALVSAEIVTSDPRDLRVLIEATDRPISLIEV